MKLTRRALFKTITWRITGSTLTFLIVYAATGQLAASSGIALMQAVTNTIAYYVHERIWDAVTSN